MGATDVTHGSDYCEDCGTRMHAKICPNCDEELLIVTEQAADIDFALSEEFASKVEEQKQRVIEKRREESLKL